MTGFLVRVPGEVKGDYDRMLAEIDGRDGAGAGRRAFDAVFGEIKSQFDRGATKIYLARETQIKVRGGHRVYSVTVDGWRIHFVAYVQQQRLWIFRISPPGAPIS